MGMFKEYDGSDLRRWSSKDVLETFLESDKDTAELNLEELLGTTDPEEIKKNRNSVYSALRQYAVRHCLDVDIRLISGNVVIKRVREKA